MVTVEAPTDESYISASTSYQSGTEESTNVTEESTNAMAETTDDDGPVVGMEDDTAEDTDQCRLSMETAAGDAPPWRADTAHREVEPLKLHTPLGDNEHQLDITSTRSEDMAILTLDTDRSHDSARITLNAQENAGYSDDSDWDDGPGQTSRTDYTNGNGEHPGPPQIDDLDSVSVAIREDAHN